MARDDIRPNLGGKMMKKKESGGTLFKLGGEMPKMGEFVITNC